MYTSKNIYYPSYSTAFQCSKNSFNTDDPLHCEGFVWCHSETKLSSSHSHGITAVNHQYCGPINPVNMLATPPVHTSTARAVAQKDFSCSAPQHKILVYDTFSNSFHSHADLEKPHPTQLAAPALHFH
jgi:hypothetical protein